MITPLVENSACKLGLDPSAVFGQAAGVVGHPGSVSLMRWLARAPEDRSLKSMGFVEGADAGGFPVSARLVAMPRRILLATKILVAGALDEVLHTYRPRRGFKHLIEVLPLLAVVGSP